MELLTRDKVRTEVVELLKEVREDHDPTVQITDKTGLFKDLGFESIDAVGMGSTLEAHFDQTLPFPEFMAKAKEQNMQDISIGYLLDFLMANLQGSAEKTASTPN